MSEIDWSGFSVPMKLECDYYIERGVDAFELKVFSCAKSSPGKRYFCYAYEAPKRRSPVVQTEHIEPSELRGLHLIAMSKKYSTAEEPVQEMLQQLRKWYPEVGQDRVKSLEND